MSEQPSAPVGSQRPGGRTERTRVAVLRATAELLAEVGYDGLAVEAIAARAGVHKTTVYRRWPELPELVADAMIEHAGRSIPVPDTGSLAEDLRLLARSVAANLSSRGQVRRAASIIAAAAHSEDVAARAHTFWRQRMSAARVIVDRAIDRGELPAGTDAWLVLEMVVGPVWFRALATGEPVSEYEIDLLVGVVSSHAAVNGA